MDRPCFWNEDGRLKLIDQRELPGRVSIIEAGSLKEQVEAVNTLAVRGAPAIGAFGAFSLSLAISRGEDPGTAYGSLIGSRPTAVDLRNCLDEVMGAFLENGKDGASDAASGIYERTIEACRRIGRTGARLLPDNARVMTHCNAGALASIDWGTALSPIRVKARAGGDPFVWVSETRPLLQGARLTSWELLEEDIEHRIVVDSASGYLMRKRDVDLVITGADRVCANGDFANKVGTYEKAVLARENGVPFYVAFPRTTIDRSCASGASIPIEERDGEEVTAFNGSRTAPAGARAFNPAFDVTPGELVSAYITEDGIFTLDEFKEIF
ncbi:MAG: S-methyl-5-thioribose-1-phosphate isomerase [Thermoplasmatota archaeon]